MIGGDGSLTGANLFRQEWSSLLDELLENNKITKDQREKYKFLHIAGMVINTPLEMFFMRCHYILIISLPPFKQE